MQEFESKLDTSHPEKGEYAVEMLGFGEISIVVEILHEGWKGLALKRIPIFDTVDQVEQHITAYNEYNRILRDEVGLNIPDYGTEWVYTDTEKKKTISLYCIQEKHNPKSVCHHLIHQLSHEEEIEQLILLIMQELHKVWKYNLSQEKYQLGIDGQISNWILDQYEVSKRVYSTSKLMYIDTSTPMIRIDGKEMMNAEGQRLGRITQIQESGEPVSRADEGVEVAVSMPRPVFGRHIKEKDVLYVDLPEEDIRKLREKFASRLTESSLEVLIELVEIKRKKDPIWAM